MISPLDGYPSALDTTGFCESYQRQRQLEEGRGGRGRERPLPAPERGVPGPGVQHRELPLLLHPQPLEVQAPELPREPPRLGV